MTAVRAGGTSKEKGRRGLAWASYILAAAAGAAATGTFIGHTIGGFVHMFPTWVGVGLLLAVLAAMGMDLYVDGEPNQIALYSAMVLPSLAVAVPGKLAASVGTVSDALLTQLNKALGEWLGQTTGIGLVVVFAVTAYFMGRRVVAKGGGGVR